MKYSTAVNVESNTKSSSQSTQVQSKEQSNTQPVKVEEQKNTGTSVAGNLSQTSNAEELKVANVSTVVTKTSSPKINNSSTGTNSSSNSATVATDNKASDSNNAEGKTSEPLIVPSVPAVQTLTGYIEDVHCFFSYADPAADTKGCLSMISCSKSGYGITVPQSDGSKKFYFFDGNFTTFADGKTFDGTDSQLAAWNLIKNTTKKNNVTIKVTGILEKAEKTYVNSKGESYSFPVLKVNTLAETSTLSSIAITTPATKLVYSVGDALDLIGLQVTGSYEDNTKVVQAVTAANVTGFDSSKPVEGQALTITVGGKVATYTININQQIQSFTGYIIDEDCFVSYDNPGDDTKMCLSMKSCAASGYGIAVPKNDGSFKFYYFDGTFATYENKVFTQS